MTVRKNSLRSKMSLKHPSILKRHHLIGKSYAKKEISAATFVSAKTFTLFMDADIAKVDNQHEKILAADVEDLEEYHHYYVYYHLYYIIQKIDRD